MFSKYQLFVILLDIAFALIGNDKLNTLETHLVFNFTFFFVTVSEANNCTEPNQEWPEEECYNRCAYSCNSHNGNTFCTADCQPKQCDCIKDYYRDSHGNCISKADCEKCTAEHEEFKHCYNYCATSCRTILAHTPCTKECQLDGCDCQKNFYRDPYTEKCVPKSECGMSDV